MPTKHTNAEHVQDRSWQKLSHEGKRIYVTPQQQADMVHVQLIGGCTAAL